MRYFLSAGQSKDKNHLEDFDLKIMESE